VLGELREAGDNGKFEYFLIPKDEHKQLGSSQARRCEGGFLTGSRCDPSWNAAFGPFWCSGILQNLLIFFFRSRLCVGHVGLRSRDISWSSSEKHCDIDRADSGVNRYINL
jgi:hypothetical protein